MVELNDQWIILQITELPDPAVCFDDEGYKPSSNDIPQTYNVVMAIQDLDINLFSLGINNLYNNVKPYKLPFKTNLNRL